VLDIHSEANTKTVGRRRRMADSTSLGSSDGGSDLLIDARFPNAVVRAIALLDKCADDLETAQMFVRMRLRGEDLEEVVEWGEVLEVLRVNERNQA